MGKRGAGVMGFVGTLLGPEATSPAPFGVGVWCFGLAALAGIPVHRFGGLSSGVVGAGAGVGCGVGLLFENCTVDASIFVAKFLRAHGGCLGIRSR